MLTTVWLGKIPKRNLNDLVAGRMGSADRLVRALSREVLDHGGVRQLSALRRRLRERNLHSIRLETERRSTAAPMQPALRRSLRRREQNQRSRLAATTVRSRTSVRIWPEPRTRLRQPQKWRHLAHCETTTAAPIDERIHEPLGPVVAQRSTRVSDDCPECLIGRWGDMGATRTHWNPGLRERDLNERRLLLRFSAYTGCAVHPSLPSRWSDEMDARPDLSEALPERCPPEHCSHSLPVQKDDLDLGKASAHEPGRSGLVQPGA